MTAKMHRRNFLQGSFTVLAGGQGAVREVAELILRARGEWQGLLTKYFVERGDVAHGAQRSR